MPINVLIKGGAWIPASSQARKNMPGMEAFSEELCLAVRDLIQL
jgi:hypothetical protein